GTEFVKDTDTGQLIEQDKFSTSDDRSADTITILGHDGNPDTLVLSDKTQNGITGIGVTFTGGPVTVIVSDSVRGEGDTLVISTRGGADFVDASAMATDRAALKILG